MESITNFILGLRSVETFYLLQEYTFVLPAISLVFYLSVVHGHKQIRKFLPKININMKPIMVVWNLFFSVFSFFMFIGVFFPYLEIVKEHGFLNTLHDADRKLFVPSDMQIWGSFFVLSKYLELFDTIFVLIKNPEKQVEFLHWYHHFTVLFFTWFSWYLKYPPAFYFMLMNSAIHVVMYFYYMLKELDIHPTWGFILTAAQTLQMFAGVALNVIWTYLYLSGYDCPCKHPIPMVTMASTIYFSYLLLFLQFYTKKYKKK